MATTSSGHRAGGAGRHKAARPIPSGQIGKHAPRSSRNEEPAAADRPLDSEEDEPMMTRSKHDPDSAEPRGGDGFEGSDR